MKERVKHVLRTYGRVAVLFHSSVFFTTLGGSYAAIRHGVDVQHMLQRLPFVDASKLDPNAGTLALAYVSTLATGPARGALTIAAAPFLARVFTRGRRIGK